MGNIIATQGPNPYTIGTTAVRVCDKNRSRAGFTLEADDGNTGNIFFAYDRADVTNAGAKIGSKLKAGAQAVESPPNVFTGEVWAIASAAGQVLYVFETTDLDQAAKPGSQ
jgi:hypothetical protein